MAEEKLRLGDLLIANGVITEDQLKDAIAEQKRTGAKLGQALVDLGFVQEDLILNTLSKQLDIPSINLQQYELNFNLAKTLPEAYARRFRAVVLAEQESGLFVGMVDPMDIHAVDELKHVLKKPISLALVREHDLLNTLDLIYRRTDDITDYAEKLDEQLGDDAQIAELNVTDSDIDAPVIRLLQSVFEDALQVGASDIHIEPGEDILRIRLRVDGVLHEQVVKERNIAPAIILRLKLISGLNIAEKRLPQDGRFNIRIRDKIVDVRLSILPTQYGESGVMRLLDQSTGLLELSQIGMPENVLTRFKRLLQLPYGMILVTGPTGSGKSTTLYGALNTLNSPEKKIITIEDPIEYRLPRINQIQVNDKLGLSFVRVLRTTLRQDPDIIMLGEMRDKEAAEVAIRAALTGHLVFSTLHTNDSPSAMFRLVDMGVQTFLIAATVKAILAQRLVRKICTGCIEDYTPTPQEQSWLETTFGDSMSQVNFKIGKGCTYCNHTGYRGREGVFELLELNSDMLRALHTGKADVFSEKAKEALKGELLVDNALALAKQGLTSLAEVLRVTGEE